MIFNYLICNLSCFSFIKYRLIETYKWFSKLMQLRNYSYHDDLCNFGFQHNLIEQKKTAYVPLNCSNLNDLVTVGREY